MSSVLGERLKFLLLESSVFLFIKISSGTFSQFPPFLTALLWYLWILASLKILGFSSVLLGERKRVAGCDLGYMLTTNARVNE